MDAHRPQLRPPSTARSPRRLGQYLSVSTGALQAALDRQLASQGGERMKLGSLLLAQGAVDAEALHAAVLAQRADRLRACKLFSNVKDEEMDRLCHRVTEVSVFAGERFLQQGAEGDCFFIIASGSVLIYGTYEEEEAPLATAGPGDTLGEMGYFSDGTRSASARAVESTEMLRFAYADLPDSFRHVPTLATGFLELVTKRLRETNLNYQANRRLRMAAETSLRHLSEYLSQIEHIDLRRGIEGLIDRVVRTASKLMNADRASLFLLDPPTGDLWSLVAEGEELREIRVRAGAGVVGWVAKHGAIANIPDAYADPRFSRVSDQRTGYRTRSVLCGPVRSLQGQIIGVIQVIDQAVGKFTNEDEILFKAFAHQASIAIENLNLYQRVVENSEKIALMLDVASSLSQTLDLASLIRRIVAKITEILQCGQSSLFLFDRERNELWSMEAQGSGLKEIRFPATQGLAGHTARTGEALNVTDAYQDPRFNPSVDRITGVRTRSVLCMPVYDRDGVVAGVTQAINKSDGSFGEEDLAFLRAISSQIAVALENAQLYARTVNMKNYLQSVQESISSGILTLDNEWKIITANKAAVELLAMEPSRCVNCDIRAVLEAQTDDKPSLLLSLIAKVYATRRSAVAYNVDVVWPGGRSGTLDMNILPLADHKGERQGLVVVLDDITYEKQVKSALTRYLNEDIVERMLADPGRQALGGVAGKATILFSDIREFTRITEHLTAAETMDFLNSYFALMVEEIIQQQGVLDKFIGDGLMAVFGVPYARPDDATRAVRAALRMKAALVRFNADLIASGRDPVRVGIGVNTGEVISGNIGTQKRMDFTVLGDSVNTASRLESLSKQYGCEVLVSDSVILEIGAAFVVRPVDKVIVKGRSKPTEVFEVLGERGHRWTAAEECSTLAIEAYRRHDFAAAIDILERCASRDGLCDVFLDRCRHLLHHPPPPDWDGVWRALSK